MNTESRIFIAGTDKAMGKAIANSLQEGGYKNIIKNAQPDFTCQQDVNDFFAKHRPERVVIAAGKSGGITYNRQNPATLIYDNLMTEANLIHAAYKYKVEKLLYLASSCSYPRLSEQPIKEEYLLTGRLEPTNQPYAIAKIAGIELCNAYRSQHGCNFISAIPTNYFGPGDDFSPENSHVIGALIRRIHEARIKSLPEVEIWGTGNPKREFIYTEDLGKACVFLLEKYDSAEHINIGTGYSLSISELAEIICSIVGYKGKLTYDTSKPDGMPFKELDSSRLTELGWKSECSFQKAIEATYQWFANNYKEEK